MNTNFNLKFDLQLFVDATVNSNYAGTDNNDSITSSGKNIQIDANGGNDRIYHTAGSGASIFGGAGRETIIAYAEKAYIDGGDGNDLINLNLGAYKSDLESTSNSTGATIIGGKGADTIRADVDGTGRTFVFGSDDGADVIYGIKTGDTISLEGGASLSSSVYSGEDFLLTIGNTRVLLKKPTDGFNNVKLTVGGTDYTIPSLYQGTKNSERKENTSDSDNIVLEMLGGNDSVSNSGSYVTVYGGAGADTIINTGGSNIMLDGEAGNDLFSVVAGTGVTVEGGAGADTVNIESGAGVVTIIGGAGNDYFKAKNSGNVYIYTEGEGKDTIEGYSTNDTIIINAGIIGESKFEGSDFVVGIGKGSLTFKNIDADTTNKITLISPNSTIPTEISVPRIVQGTKSAETLTSSKANYKIDAGAGNDVINVSGGSNVVMAGAGNDVINLAVGSAGANVYVGAGSDVINISAGSGAHTFVFGTTDGINTISGLTSADILSFGTSTLGTAISADGNNFLLTSSKTTVAVANYFDIAGTKFTTMQTGKEGSNAEIEIPKILQGTKGNDSALTLANTYSDYVIDALAGNDTINNGGSTVTILADAGNDEITNTGSTVIIKGGDGNDTITNSGTTVTIAGEKGNDSIINSGASVTIDGGAGVDDIVNSGSSVSVYGGDGADKISLADGTDSVTINGGTGNDGITVTGASNVVFNYASGDGNDDIYGYGKTNSISITGSTVKTDISGTDFVITVGEGKTAGKITLHRGQNYD